MISKKESCIPILVEKEAYAGTRRIAEKSAADMELILGGKPQIMTALSENTEHAIMYATVGVSPLLERLEENGKICLNEIRGKREVYGIFYLQEPFAGTDGQNLKELLVVAGSDKRGTIYGIFSLSEKIGVSPLIFWGDAAPAKRESISFTKEMEEISKEPSVKYRGFFINDEWPCFGNWTMEHFGGFTAKMYDHVYELLLRLKGNYLWPAMWSSSFALDGPDLESAKLADEYGVIIGNSHHEPCLRASEEWDIYKVQKLGYGMEWDYSVNSEGLLNYWRDGLKRSGVYESIITIGMRGERDSELVGTHTLAQCIDMLKEIITKQQELISEYADTPERKHPRLLAIYKEVESYFYGDGETPGLKDWDGLKDVILMFCEDNYGNMRWLPDEKIRNHKGGFGMYYHLDYHGSPVSYEWINSTPLTKVWEQMTQAYEYGVRDVWVVNVGDLKGNEFPLSYFMNLAYDYEKWGVGNRKSAEQYTLAWARQTFGAQADDELCQRIAELMTQAVLLLYKRRPEALDSHTYHPAHYGEADAMLRRAQAVLAETDEIRQQLKTEAHNAYYSMLERPVKSGLNLLLMQLYAGKNEWYAYQGKVIANEYGTLLADAMQKEKEYNEQFKRFLGGKWSGMELGNHIGFTKWNEDGCKMPVRCTVEPFEFARMLVSRADEGGVYVKNYGTYDTIEIKDFLDVKAPEVKLEIANGGNRKFTCTAAMETECDWLSLDWMEKEIHAMEILTVSCREDKLPDKPQMASFLISDSDAVVRVKVWGCRQSVEGYPEGTYFERLGTVSMLAKNAAYTKEADGAAWQVLENAGVTESGCKVFPIGKTFEAGKGPVLGYRFVVREEGEYNLHVVAAPSNAAERGSRMHYGLRVNDGDLLQIPSLPEDFRAGNPDCEDWCRGVLEQAHKNTVCIRLNAGLNTLEFSAIEPGFLPEKLMISREPLKESYLGMPETFRLCAERKETYSCFPA